MNFLRQVGAVGIGLAALTTAANSQTTKPQVPAPATVEAFADALRNAAPGDIVRTSFARLDSLPRLAVALKSSDSPSLLVFSDRPEYFRAGNGIASQDTVEVMDEPRRVRFYTYHVPVLVGGKGKRVLTVFENLTDREATLKFSTYSEPKPSGDYNAMAKKAMTDWFTDDRDKVVKIAPHDRYLSDNSKEVFEKSDLLVHGLFEFTTDRSLRLTVAQVTATDHYADDVKQIDSLPKLPMLPYGPSKDKANRGVFKTGDIEGTLQSTYDTANGPAQFVVADGKTDPWQPGTDGISGDATINKGNYGIAYHLKLHYQSSDNRGLAVLLSTSRFDSDCGNVAAAVKVNNGKHPGGVIELPRNAVRFHGTPEACVIQTFTAPAGGEGTIDLTYTPPGACCLPIPILLVPMN